MDTLRFENLKLREERDKFLADRDRAETSLSRLIRLCDKASIRRKYKKISKLVDSLLGRTEPMSELEEQAAEIAELRETIAKLSK